MIRFIQSIINISLILLGGILGSIIASWITGDLWQNFFSIHRIIFTFIGIITVVLILAHLDSIGRKKEGVEECTQIRKNIQIGKPLIRVLKGSNY